MAAFAAVACTPWSKVVRETRYDGGVQREHLVLGKLRLTSMANDPGALASLDVERRLASYGFHIKGSGLVTTETSRVQYHISEKAKGDIRQESARLAKEMPWLKQVWHGTRFTSFYARGFHPTLKGFVEVMYGRLPERKHGPGMLQVTISVSE